MTWIYFCFGLFFYGTLRKQTAACLLTGNTKAPVAPWAGYCHSEKMNGVEVENGKKLSLQTIMQCTKQSVWCKLMYMIILQTTLRLFTFLQADMNRILKLIFHINQKQEIHSLLIAHYVYSNCCKVFDLTLITVSMSIIKWGGMFLEEQNII